MTRLDPLNADSEGTDVDGTDKMSFTIVDYVLFELFSSTIGLNVSYAGYNFK